jgi:hypothetical protein
VVVAAAIAVTLVLLFGPMTYAAVTGRPMSVACGGLDAAACDDAWRSVPDGLPVTWFRIEGHATSATCFDYTVGHWWPAFDPFATTAYPLCQ